MSQDRASGRDLSPRSVKKPRTATTYYESKPIAYVIPLQQVIVQTDGSGAVQSTVLDNLSATHNGTWRRYGVSQPNWRALIAAGRNATTPFEGSRVTASGTSGTMFSRRPNGTWDYQCTTTGHYTPGAGFPDAFSVDTSYCDNQALTRILKKIRKHRTKFTGATFLGELRQTIGMMRRPATALRNGVNKYFQTVDKRLRKVRNVPQMRKVISDSYLEASFGWEPAISDIADISKEVKRLGEADQRTRLSAFCQDESAIFDIVDSAGLFGTDHPIRVNRYVKELAYVRYTVGMRVSMQAFGVPKILTQFGLTKSELVPALWELTPWSFLWDYFTNIGDLISAASTVTEDVLWVCKTTRRSRQWIYTAVADENQFYQWYPTGILEGSPGSCVMSASAVSRTPLEKLPMPRFEFSVPGFSRKWLNMAALAASRTSALTTFYNVRKRISRPSTS